MAFPRKNTRRLSVDGIPYTWHLNDDWDIRTRWIVVRREVSGAGQLLMVDPYHHDLLPTRGSVSRAVRFALSHGWHPERKCSPLRLTFGGRDKGFQVNPGAEPDWYTQRRDCDLVAGRAPRSRPCLTSGINCA